MSNTPKSTQPGPANDDAPCEATAPIAASPTLSRPRQILAGMRGQNERATFEGQEGFWVQADCIFVPARNASAAIMEYRRIFEGNHIACSHNHFCGSIMREKERFEHEAVLAAAKQSSEPQPVEVHHLG